MLYETELKQPPCHMCLNSRVDPELNDENDFSAHTLTYAKDFRIILLAGGGKPVRIVFEGWNKVSQVWQTLADYEPKFCPNCGRDLTQDYKK